MASKKDLTIEEQINKEVRRLKKIFDNIDEDKKKIVQGLFENAAFLSTQMKLMMSRINEDGVTIKYQNGENQWGYKKSPDVDTYNSFIKQYTTIIKQLTDLLPKDNTIEIDAIEEFKKKFNSV